MLAIYPFTHIDTIMSFWRVWSSDGEVSHNSSNDDVGNSYGSPETGHNIIIYHVVSNGSLEADTLEGNWYSCGILVFTGNGCY